MTALHRLRVRHEDDGVTSHVTSLEPTSTSETDPSPPPAGSVDLAYTTLGNGPHKLVFIAGMCVPHNMWSEQIAHFTSTKNHTLLLLDNRGVGESTLRPTTPPKQNNASIGQTRQPGQTEQSEQPGQTGASQSPYTISIMARDVLAVVNHAFGKDATIHVVGHSMGSMIAQRVALHAPDRIASLSLLCGHDGGWFWNYTPSLRLLRAGIAMLTARENPDLLANVYLELHFTSTYLKTAAQPHDATQHATTDPHTDPQQRQNTQAQSRREEIHKRYTDGIRNDKTDCSAFWGHMNAVRSHYLHQGDADKLRKLACPKLVVYGREDAVVLPRASRQLAARIGAQAVGVDAAHFAMQEAADEINKLLALHIGYAAKVWERGDVPGDEVVPNACVRLVRESGDDDGTGLRTGRDPCAMPV